MFRIAPSCRQVVDVVAAATTNRPPLRGHHWRHGERDEPTSIRLAHPVRPGAWMMASTRRNQSTHLTTPLLLRFTAGPWLRSDHDKNIPF